eukprot:30891_3
MTRARMKYCWFTRFFCCNEKRPEPRISVVTKAPTGITALSLPNASNMKFSNAEIET